MNPRAEPQVVEHRERGERAAPLGQVRDAALRHPFGRAPVEALAVEQHVAARLDGAGDRAQRGRLARAVGAEDRDEVAGGDGQREAVQRLDLAVARLDVAQLKERQGAPAAA